MLGDTMGLVARRLICWNNVGKEDEASNVTDSVGPTSVGPTSERVQLINRPVTEPNSPFDIFAHDRTKSATIIAVAAIITQHKVLQRPKPARPHRL